MLQNGGSDEQSVAQATNSSAGVILNTESGQTTMNTAQLNAGVEVTFTVQLQRTRPEAGNGPVVNIAVAASRVRFVQTTVVPLGRRVALIMRKE